MPVLPRLSVRKMLWTLDFVGVYNFVNDIQGFYLKQGAIKNVQVLLADERPMVQPLDGHPKCKSGMPHRRSHDERSARAAFQKTNRRIKGESVGMG